MKRSLAIWTLTLAFPLLARAHPGPRIWLNIDGSRIATYFGPYPPTTLLDYTRAQVFTQPLIDEGGDEWDNDFPGYQQVPGGILPTGFTLTYNIAEPLLWYNPGDLSHSPFFQPITEQFTSAPAPQFAITNELFQSQFTSTGFVNGNIFYTNNGNPGDHNHLTYSLLGDGANIGGGPDGIYALPLQFTALGYSPTDTVYLLLGKNAAPADLQTAQTVANATLATLRLGPAQNLTFDPFNQATLILEPQTTLNLTTQQSLAKFDSLQLDPTAKLDLSNNSMIVGSLTNTTSFTSVQNQIRQAAHFGAWNGTSGITSSSAHTAATSSTATALAYATGAQFTANNGRTLFAGQSFNPTDTLILYTFAGDANMDQSVTFADFLQLQNHYNQPNTDWQGGDFNYDGSTTFADFLILQNNYNKTLNNASLSPASSTAVPEPSSLILALIPLALTVRRRQARRLA